MKLVLNNTRVLMEDTNTLYPLAEDGSPDLRFGVYLDDIGKCTRCEYIHTLEETVSIPYYVDNSRVSAGSDNVCPECRSCEDWVDVTIEEIQEHRSDLLESK